VHTGPSDLRERGFRRAHAEDDRVVDEGPRRARRFHPGRGPRSRRAPPEPGGEARCHRLRNDLIAIGVLDAARKHGLQVPGELAVTGYDDIDAASLVHPALTTVVNPAREVGRACGEALLRQLKGDEAEPARELVIANSFRPTRVGLTAPPRDLFAQEPAGAVNGADHQPHDPRELLRWEIAQRQESGFVLGALARRAASSDGTDAGAAREVLAISTRQPRAGLGYEEPRTSMPSSRPCPIPLLRPAIGDAEKKLRDRTLGAGSGPAPAATSASRSRNGEHWTAGHLRTYLELAGAYPLRDTSPSWTRCLRALSCRVLAVNHACRITRARATTTSTTRS